MRRVSGDTFGTMFSGNCIQVKETKMTELVLSSRVGLEIEHNARQTDD